MLCLVSVSVQPPPAGRAGGTDWGSICTNKQQRLKIYPFSETPDKWAYQSGVAPRPGMAEEEFLQARGWQTHRPVTSFGKIARGDSCLCPWALVPTWFLLPVAPSRPHLPLNTSCGPASDRPVIPKLPYLALGGLFSLPVLAL